MTERRCAWCGERFILKRRDQRTCTGACRKPHNNDEQNRKHRTAPAPRSCVACRTVFAPVRSDRRACSSECYRKLRYRQQDNWHTKACAHCSTPFTAKRSDAMYCKHRCYLTANYDSTAATARAAAWASANPDRVRAHKVQTKLKRRLIKQASPGVLPRDWIRLLRRHDYCCAYCGVRSMPLHMDHVVPLARGGRHQIGNVLPACASCNLRKHANLLSTLRYGKVASQWSQVAQLRPPSTQMRSASKTIGHTELALPASTGKHPARSSAASPLSKRK